MPQRRKRDRASAYAVEIARDVPIEDARSYQIDRNACGAPGYPAYSFGDGVSHDVVDRHGAV